MANAIPLLIEMTFMRGGKKFKEMLEVSCNNINEVRGDIKDLLSRPGIYYTVKTEDVKSQLAKNSPSIDTSYVQGNQVILLIISFLINVLSYFSRRQQAE